MPTNTSIEKILRNQDASDKREQVANAHSSLNTTLESIKRLDPYKDYPEVADEIKTLLSVVNYEKSIIAQAQG